jgi:excisionase family DNA binding protein
MIGTDWRAGQNPAMDSHPDATRLVPSYLTVSEAAAYVRLHPEHLQKLVRRGDGPARLKIGRSVRFARQELDRWMASHGPQMAA